jgi:hypothetical protein
MKIFSDDYWQFKLIKLISINVDLYEGKKQSQNTTVKNIINLIDNYYTS